MSEDVTPPTPTGSAEAEGRLFRSRVDRVIGGVCGGLGRYLGVDPLLLRIAAVALAFLGVGILAYIIAWIVIPEAPADRPEPPVKRATSSTTVVMVGAVLVLLGVMLLFREIFPWFNAGVIWALIIIAVGLFVLRSARG